MNDITVIRNDLTKLEPQFAAALPSHITPAKFVRVAMTAINNEPKLRRCDRQSLFNACMQAAQDGLLPDGREGAILPYGNKAKWLPMVIGLRKKARNSGDISDWRCEIVRVEDEFDYQLGDKPSLWHKPKLGSNSPIIATYSIVVLKDGTISREVMSIEEVEAIRKAYVRHSGPWDDPVAYPEMCKKTVARRHSKQLPMSSDLDDLLRRDDELYELNAEKEPEQKLPPRRGRTVADQFDDFASGEEIGDGEAPDKSREETPNGVSHREPPPSSAND